MRRRPHKARPALVYDTYLGQGVSGLGRVLLTKHASARYVWVDPIGGSDSYTGLDAVHTTGITGPKATLNAGWTALRGGLGDWLLLPAGVSFAEGFGSVYGRIGLSAEYPTVVTTYDTADPTNAAKYRLGRVIVGTAPTVTTTINGLDNVGANRYSYGFTVIENMDWTKAAISNDQFQFVAGVACDGILIENCRLSQTQLSFTPSVTTTNVCIRRSSFHKGCLLGAAHGQGIYGDKLNGVTVEDCVLHHNGWIGAARDDVVTSGGEPDIFKHNLYFSTDTYGVTVRRCVSGFASSHGMQLRGGANLTYTVCINNPINVLGGGGDDYDDFRPDGVTFNASRIVISGSSDIDGSTPRGFGFSVVNTTAASSITDSIIAHVSAESTNNIVPLQGQADFPQPTIFTYERNIQYDWGSEPYAASGSQPGQVSVTRNNNRWDNESASGTNTVFSAGSVPDATRSAESYATAHGYADADAMLVAACLEPSGDWALNIGDWIRAGFGR